MQVSRLTLLPTLLLALLFGCATNEPSTQIVTSALEDSCSYDEKDPYFDNYDAVAACAAEQPDWFLATINAMVQVGGTCTVTDEKSGSCTSIEPIKDDVTEKLRWFPVRCNQPFCRFAPDGTWVCDGHIRACCFRVDETIYGQEEVCVPQRLQ